MRTILTAFLVLCCSAAFAQKTDVVKNIKSKYEYIEKNISTFTKRTVDDYDASTEGGEINGYYKGGKLLLIVTCYYGEQGKSHTEYFFNNGALFFVLDETYSYNIRFYDKDFDQRKTKLETSRFYFNDGNLIKWTREGKEIEQIDSEFHKEENRQLEEVKRAIKLLK